MGEGVRGAYHFGYGVVNVGSVEQVLGDVVGRHFEYRNVVSVV